MVDISKYENDLNSRFVKMEESVEGYLQSVQKIDTLEIDLKEVQTVLKKWEMGQMMDISNREEKVDGKMKKVFSNDSAREAELERRKGISPEYQEFKNTEKGIIQNRMLEGVRKEKCYREMGLHQEYMKNIRAVLGVIGRVNE